MRQATRKWSAAVLAAVLVGALGCGNDATPNPSLKVPDVSPGGHGAKKSALANPGKKQPGRK